MLSQYELIVFKLHKLIMCMYGEVHVRNVHVCTYMYMISTCKCILIKMMCEVREFGLNTVKVRFLFFIHIRTSYRNAVNGKLTCVPNSLE